ncbi:hypothetical protein ACEPAI_6698 [Sanghuangporus weigelae]
MSASKLANLSWRRSARTQSGEGSVFRRPLGAGELRFYWDSAFNGTAVTIGHLVLEAEPEYEKRIFCKENIETAWTRLKQRFPLLAASVDELPDSKVVEFVLDEMSLRTVRHGEISFLDDLQSEEDATRLIDRLQNGPPVLTNEIIAKLMIGPQRNRPHTYHAIIVISHCITDGVTGMTLKRELCQELAKLSQDHILKKPLEERLYTLLPVESLGPHSKDNPSRRRWFSAVAKIIYQLRQARFKGGHTLPTVCRVEPDVPALSRTLTLHLPALQTRQVLDKCRELGITFGNALPVLSQLAFTRVLYRCRREGSPLRRRSHEVSDIEWEYRRVQPMHFAGPLNLRPYLDRRWYDAGGASNVCMAVGSYHIVLPCMPTPEPIYEELSFDSAIVKPQSLSHWLNGPRRVNCYLSDEPELDFFSGADLPSKADVPTFSSLLSPRRFLHRAHMVWAQNAAFMRHPLLHELQVTHMHELCRQSRDVGLAWRARQLGLKQTARDIATKPCSSPPVGSGYVISNGGASLGNRDLLLPLHYPLSSTSSARDSAQVRPRLHIRDNIIHLRCRPGELYLGALAMQEQLTFFVYVDARVYDLNIVQDWLEDVRAGTLHYFGDGAVDVTETKSWNMGVVAGATANLADDRPVLAKL